MSHDFKDDIVLRNQALQAENAELKLQLATADRNTSDMLDQRNAALFELTEARSDVRNLESQWNQAVDERDEARAWYRAQQAATAAAEAQAKAALAVLAEVRTWAGARYKRESTRGTDAYLTAQAEIRGILDGPENVSPKAQNVDASAGSVDGVKAAAHETPEVSHNLGSGSPVSHKAHPNTDIGSEIRALDERVAVLERGLEKL